MKHASFRNQAYIGVLEGLSKGITPNMDNKMDKTMENEVETYCCFGFGPSCELRSVCSTHHQMLKASCP